MDIHLTCILFSFFIAGNILGLIMPSNIRCKNWKEFINIFNLKEFRDIFKGL